MPASIIPTMAMPINVPYSLPEPPNTLVPPMNTAANTNSMYPSPCVGHHDPISMHPMAPAKPAMPPMSVCTPRRAAGTLMPSRDAMSACSPVNRMASPSGWRFRRSQRASAITISQSDCMGRKPPSLPASTLCVGLPPRSASPSASPWLSSMTAPRQKNCVPMVAMMDGTPTYATRKPLQRPIPKPIRMATMTPSQTCPVCIAVSAKPNPATASVEGKHKSISPAATTNVSPSARKPYRGKVESRLSYMGHARNARAPVIMNSASNAKNNPVSHSWLRVLAGNARRMRPPITHLSLRRGTAAVPSDPPGTSPRAVLHRPSCPYP